MRINVSEFWFVGNAGRMGQTPNELEHKQTGAETESTSRTRCVDMVRKQQQTATELQIYDEYNGDNQFR